MKTVPGETAIFFGMSQPTFTSRKLYQHDMRWRKDAGVELIGGVDEAGRGALAGPVVAGCVVLGPEARLRGVNDSKQLRPAQRAAMVPEILAEARAWGLGWSSAAEIDRVNILEATLLAAAQALRAAAPPPQLLLTDFLKIRQPPCRCEPLAGGDAKSLAIAAASVLAKVARDRIMAALDKEYPQYGFARHKGYGAAEHLARLRGHGPCVAHRMTFRGVLPEPFFGEELAERPPLVHCASRAALAGRPRPPLDWAGILTERPEALEPVAFLPEGEWLP